MQWLCYISWNSSHHAAESAWIVSCAEWEQEVSSGNSTASACPISLLHCQVWCVNVVLLLNFISSRDVNFREFYFSIREFQISSLDKNSTVIAVLGDGPWKSPCSRVVSLDLRTYRRCLSSFSLYFHYIAPYKVILLICIIPAHCKLCN